MLSSPAESKGDSSKENRGAVFFLPQRSGLCRSNHSSSSACYSLDEGGNARNGMISTNQLTLRNLGFTDDGEGGFESPSTTQSGNGNNGRKRHQSGAAPSAAAEQEEVVAASPSPEEMKQAALDASYILAGIAGMKLPPPKKQVAEVEEKEEKEDEAAEAVESGQKPTCNHPWPEWVEFLEDIQGKGFFEGSEQWVDEGKALLESYSAVRHAICAFGRERPDIFRSLKRKDLRVLANYGCPDLERKACNASKRLRAHFDIPEGEVCQNCRLKMSCPRAFLAPPSKVAVKTLDVVRIITGFATNVLPNTDSFTSYPKELENSVCRLLREILTFNELPRDPAFHEEAPVERSSLESGQARKNKYKNNHSFAAAQKPGDWVCPNCDFMNFNRNSRCRECQVFRPRQEQEVLLGDWECLKCRYLNFSRNRYCRECKTERPTKSKWTGGERLPDDQIPEKSQGKSGHSCESGQKMLKGRLRYEHFEGPGKDGTDSSEEEDSIASNFGPSTTQRRHYGKGVLSAGYKQVHDTLKILTEPRGNNTWRLNSTKQNVSVEKFPEKEYEASEEDESFSKEGILFSSGVPHVESDIDLSDEEDRALLQCPSKIPNSRVSKALFRWSEDEETQDTHLPHSKKWTKKMGLKAPSGISKPFKPLKCKAARKS